MTIPEALGFFVGWLYLGAVIAKTPKDVKCLLTLHGFASKYLIEELADLALTAYIQDLQDGSLPCIVDLEKEYALASEGSSWQLFVIDAVAYALLACDDKNWPIDTFGEEKYTVHDLMFWK
jgi:hypothetical protein